ncbi:MAG: DNA gyrase subunit A, partial [Sediminibacterium sp.]|nr:DNA gyrase subunit A [Sediminibacterium sp.]
KEQIVITETPYQVNRDLLTDRIGQLVNDKTIEGISNVNNESNKREGTRIVVELKKDVVAQVVINQLFKFTELQTSYGINNVALSKGRPKQLNLKHLIQEFIEFRMEVVIRRAQYQLKKAKERAHILMGYLIALDHLDEVIRLIRNSVNPEEAKANLINAGWGIDDLQAKAILELRLQRLTGMERNKIKAEYDELMILIASLEDLLANEAKRFELIKTELIEIKTKFGDERKTEIQYSVDDMDIRDLIEKEEVVVTISHLGYIKRTSVTEYRSQKRGGRGSQGSKTREEDYVEQLFIASTHGTMLFFTKLGKCFWLPVYKIPEGEKNTKGRPIQNLISLPPGDNVKAIIDIDAFDDKAFLENNYLVFCTKQGVIKKSLLDDFSRPRANGIIAISISEGDELLDVKLTNGKQEIMLAVKSGRAIRFPETKVRPTGRGAIGVYGIDLDDTKDELVGIICVDPTSNEKTVMVVSEKGFGKRTAIDEYRITNRGGKGVKTINVNEKIGKLIAILAVTEKDDLIITCVSGLTLRTRVKDIRESGRATQGVKLIKINDTDEIAAVSTIEETEEEVNATDNISPVTNANESTNISNENEHIEN